MRLTDNVKVIGNVRELRCIHLMWILEGLVFRGSYQDKPGGPQGDLQVGTGGETE